MEKRSFGQYLLIIFCLLASLFMIISLYFLGELTMDYHLLLSIPFILLGPIVLVIVMNFNKTIREAFQQISFRLAIYAGILLIGMIIINFGVINILDNNDFLPSFMLILMGIAFIIMLLGMIRGKIQEINEQDATP